jgi:hypothetical protein
MKKLFAVLLTIILALPAFSQVKFGIKAGASTTTVPEYNSSTGQTNINSLDDANWGFHAGIFLRLGLDPVYLQPEIVFSSTTYEYNVQRDAASDIFDQSFNRLEIPILLGLKFGPLRLNAGPAAYVPIGKPSALIDDPNWDDLYRGTTFGYQAGIGVDIFNTLTLDLRYGGSLADRYGDDVTIGGTDFRLDDRQPSFIISLGVMF